MASVNKDTMNIDVSLYPTNYVFANLGNNHSIEVSYVEKLKYDVITNAESIVGGTIGASQMGIEEGESISIAYAPLSGYQLDRVLVDGVEVDKVKYATSYKFQLLDKNYTIEVVFTKQVIGIEKPTPTPNPVDTIGGNAVNTNDETSYVTLYGMLVLSLTTLIYKKKN